MCYKKVYSSAAFRNRINQDIMPRNKLFVTRVTIISVKIRKASESTKHAKTCQKKIFNFECFEYLYCFSFSSRL